MPDTEELDGSVVAEHVLAKQHLASPANVPVTRIVRDLVGLHATGPTTPYLSLLARRKGFARGDLDTELYARRRLGKIRCIRGTVFVLPAELISIAFAATRSSNEAMSLRYLASRGVLASEYERLRPAIVGVLGEGRLSVAELRKRLPAASDLSAIVNLMCDRGLLVRDRPARSWKDSSHTYSVLSEAYPDVELDLDERAATRELVLRYVRAFGPVSTHDVVWWTGLPAKRVQDALEELRTRLVPVVVHGRGRVLLERSQLARISQRSRATRGEVRFLPSLDPFVMGYKQRDWYVSPDVRQYVFDRSGNATSVILRRGRVIGVWDTSPRPRPITRFHLFQPTPPDVRAEVREEARRVGAFVLEGEHEVLELSSMAPLTHRPAGAVMTPLKDAPA